jgi:hypothetical protein
MEDEYGIPIYERPLQKNWENALKAKSSKIYDPTLAGSDARSNSTIDRTVDSEWISGAVRGVVGNKNMDPLHVGRMYISKARFMYETASVGANNCINPLPAPCYLSDVPDTGLYPWSQPARLQPPDGSFSFGMGGYYAEAFHNNRRLVHLSFGVPQYNSLFVFLNSSVNSAQYEWARTGRVDNSIAQILGNAIQTVLNIMFAPVNILVTGIVTAVHAFRFAMGWPVTAYYNIKPTMVAYWTAVNNIITTMMVNEGLIQFISPRFPKSASRAIQDLASVEPISGDNTGFYSVLKSLNRNIFKEDGSLDVYALALQARQREIAWRSALHKSLEDNFDGESGTETDPDYDPYLNGLHTFLISDEDTPTDLLTEDGSPKTKAQFKAEMRKYISNKASADADELHLIPPMNLETRLYQWATSKFGSNNNVSSRSGNGSSALEYDLTEKARKELMADGVPNPGVDQIYEKMQELNTEGGEYSAVSSMYTSVTRSVGSWLRTAGSSFNATTADGHEWVSFRVSNTETMSDSFSSNLTQNSLADKINSIGKNVRELSVNTGGLLEADSMIRQTIGSVVNSINEATGLGGLANALFGGIYLDMPKHWDSSSASFSRVSYTVPCYLPYNNGINRLLNLYLPFACILAGSAPLATGRHTHTAPFMCTCVDRGRQIVRTGMITDVSIRRGGGNQGWDRNGHALMYEIEFTVSSMDEIRAVPIVNSTLMSTITDAPKDLFTAHENPFQDWLLSLTAVELREATNKYPRMVRSLNRSAALIKSNFSPAKFGMQMGDTIVGDIFRVFNAGSIKE